MAWLSVFESGQWCNYAVPGGQMLALNPGVVLATPTLQLWTDRGTAHGRHPCQQPMIIVED